MKQTLGTDMSGVCCLVCGRPVDPHTLFYDIFQMRGGEPGSQLKARLEGVLAVTFKDNHPLFHKICEHCEVTLADIETRVRNFRLSFQKSLKRYEIQRRALLLNMGYDINRHQWSERGSETCIETESVLQGLPTEATTSCTRRAALLNDLASGRPRRAVSETGTSGVGVRSQPASLKPQDGSPTEGYENGERTLITNKFITQVGGDGVKEMVSWTNPPNIPVQRPDQRASARPTSSVNTISLRVSHSDNTELVDKQSKENVTESAPVSSLESESEKISRCCQQAEGNVGIEGYRRGKCKKPGCGEAVAGYDHMTECVGAAGKPQSCSCSFIPRPSVDGPDTSSDKILDLSSEHPSENGGKTAGEGLVAGNSVLDLTMPHVTRTEKSSYPQDNELESGGNLPDQRLAQSKSGRRSTDQLEQLQLQIQRLKEHQIELHRQEKQLQQQQPFSNIPEENTVNANAAKKTAEVVTRVGSLSESRVKPSKPPPLIQVFDIKREVHDDCQRLVSESQRRGPQSQTPIVITPIWKGETRSEHRPLQYSANLNEQHTKQKRHLLGKRNNPSGYPLLNTQVSATINVSCANDESIDSSTYDPESLNKDSLKEINGEQKSMDGHNNAGTMETTTQIRGTLRIPMVPHQCRIPTTISLETEATVLTGSMSSSSARNVSCNKGSNKPVNLTFQNKGAKVRIPLKHQPLPGCRQPPNMSQPTPTDNVMGGWEKTQSLSYQCLTCEDPIYLQNPSDTYSCSAQSRSPTAESSLCTRPSVKALLPAVAVENPPPEPSKHIMFRDQTVEGMIPSPGQLQNLPVLVDHYNNEYMQDDENGENVDTEGEEDEDGHIEEDEEGDNWESSPDSSHIRKGSKNAGSGRRQLLRPWLEDRLNRGSIPGFEWVNKERHLFKIPWKHRSKNDWTPENCTIFREWAIHTGKFSLGVDKTDYCRWKTRLRCAFNQASDIRERKDLSKTKCSEPYKVYEFLPKEEARKIAAMKAEQIQRRAVLNKKMVTDQSQNLATTYSLVSINTACLVANASTNQAEDGKLTCSRLPSTSVPSLIRSQSECRERIDPLNVKFASSEPVSTKSVSGLYLLSQSEANNNKDINDLELMSDQLVIDLGDSAEGSTEAKKRKLSVPARHSPEVMDTPPYQPLVTGVAGIR